MRLAGTSTGGLTGAISVGSAVPRHGQACDLRRTPSEQFDDNLSSGRLHAIASVDAKG